jgi:twitching motility two-component system response regulator PilH
MSNLVLVIEDDPDQRRFLERMLGTSGYRVVSAADGEAGLAAAASAHPDVIVLDVMMPRMNGYQVCRALKQEPATAGVPVVFLTTKDQPADEFWATEVGADAFLTKPIEFQTLLDEITRVMGSK